LGTSGSFGSSWQESLLDVTWKWLPGRVAAADERVVKSCVDLYSHHYGTWSTAAPYPAIPGEPIRISRDQFRRLLLHDDARLACAFQDDFLVGYCVALRVDAPGLGRIAWVSQLVVHADYRDQRIATRLLYSIWQFSDCYAWGLVTANPYAVRALETATRRPCRAAEIRRHGPGVLHGIAPLVDYLKDRSLVVDDHGKTQPLVNTGFFIDQSNVQGMRDRSARKDRRWGLGDLDEGHEWFACTFQSQGPQSIDDSRLADLLTGANDIWIQAYEGMTLDSAHSWHQHADAEIETVLSMAALREGASVIDVGCGDGRHVEALAARGFDVVGVDISERLVAEARHRGIAGAMVQEADAREYLPGGPYDLAICLYDVLGSSASPDDDRVILQNIVRALSPEGIVVASVMNTNVTIGKLAAAQRPTTNQAFLEALEGLEPSTTMEQTGSVFDPSFLIYYDGVYYRKEQFQSAEWRLPVELVVRDRRFGIDEIETLFRSAGLKPLGVRPVQAGAWDREPTLAEDDICAKELLVVARKASRE
jgi:2-polyprenyl-3-methyl-5-hydroxy-6-metoxy-1,4-benzoquinol methylase